MSQLTLHELLPSIAWPEELAALVVKQWRLDSRQVQPGDGFLGLVGCAQDGREYVPQAAAAGAVVALVEGQRFALEEVQGLLCVAVPNLRAQLGGLLAAHYQSTTNQLPVVAITGTNGKTSVAGFVQQLAAKLGQPWGLLGTFGACFNGTCEDLGLTTADAASVHRHWHAFRQQGAKGLVLEASSHALHQQRLAGLPVEVAVWTNIGRDHLDYHGTVAAYVAAKTALLQRPELQAAALSADDQRLRDLAKALSIPVYTFGQHSSSDLRYADVQYNATGVSFTLTYQGQHWPVALPLYGAFNVENALAAMAALLPLGHRIETMLPHLASLQPVHGRMEQVQDAQGPTVVVDFAHTADALAAVLSALRAHFAGRIHCVFGCGGDRDAGKRPLMAQAAEQGADFVWLTSDNPRSENPQNIIADMQQGLSTTAKVQVHVDREAAIAAAIAAAGAEDIVLIAGKGHEEEQIIGSQRHAFSDKAVASKYLAIWRAA